MQPSVASPPGRTPSLVVLVAGTLAAAAAAWMGSLPGPYAAAAIACGTLSALVLALRPARAIARPRLLRALFVGAVATWALVVGRQFPPTPAGVQQSGALVFAGLALWCLSGPPRAGGAGPTLARGFDFAVFQLALVVLGLDVGLRWVAEWRPSVLWLPALASPSAQIAAYREEPGRARFWFPCNSLGFYDDEPPAADDPRPWIACIGDSFVASSVPQPLHFSTIAENLTGETIQCFGVNAAGPREYLQLLERDVLPRRPDSLLLVLYVGNDVTDSWRIEPSCFVHCFHPDNAPLFFIARRYELLRREGESERASGGADTPKRGRVEGDTIYIDTPDGPRHATRRQLVALLPSIAPGLWDASKQRPVLDEAEYMHLKREVAQQVCSSRTESWGYFFTAMDRLLAAIGTNPVRVLLIPDEFQVSDAIWRQLVASDPALDRDLPQRRIGDYLRARSIAVLDVLPALRAAEAAGERAYLIRDSHLDRVGNEIVGRELAAFLHPPR